VGRARAVRLGVELDAWVDAVAAERGVSASDLLREAVESLRLSVEGGVPKVARARPGSSRDARSGYAAMLAARQVRLNGGKS
jgi:Arc/MetJ-type ribon-helix-helix transcriptional regulator